MLSTMMSCLALEHLVLQSLHLVSLSGQLTQLRLGQSEHLVQRCEQRCDTIIISSPGPCAGDGGQLVASSKVRSLQVGRSGSWRSGVANLGDLQSNWFAHVLFALGLHWNEGDVGVLLVPIHGHVEVGDGRDLAGGQPR